MPLGCVHAHSPGPCCDAGTAYMAAMETREEARCPHQAGPAAGAFVLSKGRGDFLEEEKEVPAPEAEFSWEAGGCLRAGRSSYGQDFILVGRETSQEEKGRWDRQLRREQAGTAAQWLSWWSGPQGAGDNLALMDTHTCMCTCGHVTAWPSVDKASLSSGSW